MKGGSAEFGPRPRGLFVQQGLDVAAGGSFSERAPRVKLLNYRYFTHAETIGFSADSIRQARESRVQQGRVYIILGASPTGIGGALARELALQGGTIVAVTTPKEDPVEDMALQEEIRALGGQGIWIGKDVTEKTAGKEIVEAALLEYGHIDSVFISTGIRRDMPSYAMSDDRMAAVWEVNYFGPMRVVREALSKVRSNNQKAVRNPEQLQRQTIKIAAASSLADLGSPGQLNYAGSKAALDNAMRTIQLESKTDVYRGAVETISIASGLVTTDLVGDLKPEQVRALLDWSGADRPLIPEEVAVLAAHALHPDILTDGCVVPIVGLGETPQVDNRKILQLAA